MKTNKLKSTMLTIFGILVFLGVLMLVENIHLMLPKGSVPKILLPTSMLFTVLKKATVYCLIAVSMNLLNGFTGLFSLGHAGFMLLGAYVYAILCTPVAAKEQIFYKFDGGCILNFSLQELFQKLFGSTGFGAAISLVLGVLVAFIIAGAVAAGFAYLIGLPVLRLKSDYLAIATLGFAEIIRTIFQCESIALPGGKEIVFGRLTNGANMIKGFPTFNSFNIKGADGKVILQLSTVVPAIVVIICIAIIVLLINSTYGRSFKAIRDDEIAAEAMGVNLAKHKILSFCTSAFFAGIGGALYAMFATTYQAKPFTTVLTYEILLIVVIGGIGSVSGSCIGSFLYIACSEWWLRFLDRPVVLSNGFKLPLLKDGFRMVIFSIVIMIVVLFFRQGIMGTRELPDLFKKKQPHKKPHRG